MIGYSINKIHKSPRSEDKDGGFTIIELVAVVSVLGTLASFGIANISKWIKLSKLDEATVVLNNSLIECLAITRGGTDPTTVSPPSEVIDNNLLESSNYKIKSGKDKCSDFFITPKNSNEKLLFEMGFQINADNKVTKISTPADQQSSLSRCKRWAGPNCGASQEQKDAWALAAAIASARKECNNAFDSWATGPPKGTTTVGQPQVRWDSSMEPSLNINNVKNACSLTTYAFQGDIVSNQDEVNKLIAAQNTAICNKKVKDENDKKVFGIKTFPSECGDDKKFYLCQGADRLNEVSMNNCKSDYEEEVCKSNKNNAKADGHTGKYKAPGGQGICSQDYWFCGTYEFTEEIKYQESECYKNNGGEDDISKIKKKTQNCLDNVSPNAKDNVKKYCKYLGNEIPWWTGCSTYGFLKCMGDE